MSGRRFSIALCTYNGARFLREQLDSYVAQERRPDELIVCDDGSSDDTVPMLRDFAAGAPFAVRIEVHAEKLGVVGNFARAIELCTGDYIALSDQDDIWMPAKLRRIDNIFAESPDVGMCFTDAVAIDTMGRPLGYGLWDAVRFTGSERQASRRGRLVDVLLRHYVVTGATLAFRSTFRDLILPIPSHCLHDAWIGLLVASVAHGRTIDEPLICYRQHPTQTSGGERILTLFDQMKRARAITPEDHAITAARFESIRQRLIERPYGVCLDKTLKMLEQKVLHARNRERLHHGGGLRLPLVAKELLTGRYYRYSHPWKSALADLFL